MVNFLWAPKSYWKHLLRKKKFIKSNDLGLFKQRSEQSVFSNWFESRRFSPLDKLLKNLQLWHELFEWECWRDTLLILWVSERIYILTLFEKKFRKSLFISLVVHINEVMIIIYGENKKKKKKFLFRNKIWRKILLLTFHFCKNAMKIFYLCIQFSISPKGSNEKFTYMKQ